jgi:toxin FitB
VSVITVEEIFYGLSAKPNLRIQTWFEGFVERYCKLLPITAEIAQRSGELRGQRRGQGKTHTQADMMIAATAQIHQLTLVTRNIRDFDDCGIPLLNPFR